MTRRRTTVIRRNEAIALAETDVRPLSEAEESELLALQVCGCGADDCAGPACPQPILDGIGCDWIADHFDNLIATLTNLRAAESALRSGISNAIAKLSDEAQGRGLKLFAPEIAILKELLDSARGAK